MDQTVLLTTPIGFLPVIAFLVILRYMDSYQLVSVRFVAALIVAGGVCAGISFVANSVLLDALSLEFQTLTRYVAPVVEELIKASVIVALLYRHRIGFLVDAAIAGFAVGAGFALVENFYYLTQGLIDNPGVWIVRGFGTALMHGGVTAIFAILAHRFSERDMSIRPILLLPALATSVVLHSGFNHFFLSPVLHTMLVVLILPPIMYIVFERSAASLHDWLHIDFDEDANILAQINSGDFTDTPTGHFLTELRERFEGPIVADMFCYLRLYTELALRAKGILMMREHGIEPPVDEDVKAMLDELKYLEDSIGKAGVITMSPYLHFTRKDLWQMYVVEGHAR